MVMVFGEITTKAKVNYEEIVRKTCKGIGFTSEDVGLDADTCKVCCVGGGVDGGGALVVAGGMVEKRKTCKGIVFTSDIVNMQLNTWQGGFMTVTIAVTCLWDPTSWVGT
jgi:hypothetical protein